MTCEDIQERLGEYLDGELDGGRRAVVADHLAACAACSREFESLQRLAGALRPTEAPDVPPGLWEAIEARRAQRHDGVPRATGSASRPCSGRPAWRPLAIAATVLVVTGLGFLAFHAPWESRAIAAQIDFRPLLERADGDVQAGIDALLRMYGGQKITLAQAAQRMRVRVQVREPFPVELPRRASYLLNLGGDHRVLAFYLSGPRGQLLLLQCPPGTTKNYGGHECLPCQVGAREGQVVRAGSLRLVHFESQNVCVCVVSTLDEERELPSALAAVTIDF